MESIKILKFGVWERTTKLVRETIYTGNDVFVFSGIGYQHKEEVYNFHSLVGKNKFGEEHIIRE